nr:DUF4123 domain-containing protein [Halomonas sp.]|tara:strand:- start:5583 stop:6410 length:828 start_codon:yes stop_codon:yes gene_type:complete
MPGWLSNISERSRRVDRPEGSLKHGQTVYVVLDQRRSPDQCRSLLSLSGKRDFIALFAGTPLSPLLEASPWLLDIEVGSEAWHFAKMLCQQRLGWVCQPLPNETLYSTADCLQALFMLDDPHGGKSLINLQQPAAWIALLASAPASIYSHWLNSLHQVATPTPQGQWLVWQTNAPFSATSERWQLSAAMEAALKESQQAWWLSDTTKIPLEELPRNWLERLKKCSGCGIKRGRDLMRLLAAIQHADESIWMQHEDILHDQRLTTKQRVSAMVSLA